MIKSRAARAACFAARSHFGRRLEVKTSTSSSLLIHRTLVTSSTQGSVVLYDVPEWKTDIEGINSDVLVVDATEAPPGFRGRSFARVGVGVGAAECSKLTTGAITGSPCPHRSPRPPPRLLRSTNQVDVDMTTSWTDQCSLRVVSGASLSLSTDSELKVEDKSFLPALSALSTAFSFRREPAAAERLTRALDRRGGPVQSPALLLRRGEDARAEGEDGMLLDDTADVVDSFCAASSLATLSIDAFAAEKALSMAPASAQHTAATVTVECAVPERLSTLILLPRGGSVRARGKWVSSSSSSLLFSFLFFSFLFFPNFFPSFHFLPFLVSLRLFIITFRHTARQGSRAPSTSLWLETTAALPLLLLLLLTTSTEEEVLATGLTFKRFAATALKYIAGEAVISTYLQLSRLRKPLFPAPHHHHHHLLLFRQMTAGGRFGRKRSSPNMRGLDATPPPP